MAPAGYCFSIVTTSLEELALFSLRPVRSVYGLVRGGSLLREKRFFNEGYSPNIYGNFFDEYGELSGDSTNCFHYCVL
jgi:hypothetical protein